MTEPTREAIIVFLIMVALMINFVCTMIVYQIISDKKEKKEKLKIKDIEQQLKNSERNYRNLYEAWEISNKEHEALALAVKLIKCCDLNLKQLEELGLQRYNALQKRGNFITDEAYEELVKNHIIIQGERYENRNKNK